jgi:hypothetical protein
VVRASVLDNPYLTDGDKERFKRKYEGTGKEDQALHGGFAAATGLVYDEFRRDVHVRPHTDLAEGVTDGWRIYGYDAGWNDPRVLLEIGRTGYGQLVVHDEFCESGTHVSDAIAWLDGKPDGTLFCEHEPGDIEKFRRAGYSAKKADKSLDTGIAEVRKRLQRDGAGDLPDAPGGDGLRRKSGSTPTIKNMNGPPDGVRSARSRGSRDTDDADDGGGVTERDGWTKTGRGTYRLTGGSSDTDDGERDTSDTGGRVGLLVSARCEQTIREFLGYKEDHVGTSQATDHCLDSLRYGVRGVA